MSDTETPVESEPVVEVEPPVEVDPDAEIVDAAEADAVEAWWSPDAVRLFAKQAAARGE